MKRSVLISTAILLMASLGSPQDLVIIPLASNEDILDIFHGTGELTDFDGNIYKIIKLGQKWWMAENLRTTHYSDGTAIPLVENSAAWDALDINDKAYCWYNNSTSDRDTYGLLYNWAAAMNGASSSFSNPSGVQGVCPDGWHLPSNKEWDELRDFLGGLEVAGGAMKEAGYDHWIAPNTGATNSSGFTALPGGRRESSGAFFERGKIARFWSTTEVDLKTVYHFGMSHDQELAGLGYYGPNGNKDYGISVRCVKEDTDADSFLIAHYPLYSDNLDITGTNMPMTLINSPFENGGVYSNGMYKYNTPEASQIVTPYRLSGFDINSFIISADFMLLCDPNSGYSPFPIWVGGTSSRWLGFGYSNVEGKHMVAILTNNNDYTFLDTELKENQWYNAKISYDGDTVRAYIDEKMIGIAEVPSFSHNYDFNVGTTNYGRGSTFNGYLKELKVYSITIPYLIVSDTTLQIGGAQSSQVAFDVLSNTSWTAQSDQSWLTINDSTGTGDQNITLISSGNSTSGPRSATVTISAEGVPASTIIITQLFDFEEFCKSADINISYSSTSPYCIGGDEGSIDITVEGSYPEFSFDWSTDSTTEDIAELGKGLYKIVVVDSAGCSDSTEIEIFDPSPIIISEMIHAPQCHGDSSGSIKIDVSGGSGSYAISWYDDSALDSITGIPVGCYTVQVIDSLGCIEQKNICIPEPEPLVMELTKEDVSCFGGASGRIYMEASGGTPAYQFQWSDQNAQQENGNLGTGIYMITAIDSNNCSVTDSIAIYEPDKIELDNIIGSNTVEAFFIYTYSLKEQDNYIYHWMVEGGNVLTGQGNHVVDIQWDSGTEGRIEVVIESLEGCMSDTSLLTVHIHSVGIGSEETPVLMIHPNPIKSLLNIGLGAHGSYTIQITSLNGKVIYNGEVEGSTHQIDLSSFHKGVYLITIRSKDFVTTRKIIKL